MDIWLWRVVVAAAAVSKLTVAGHFRHFITKPVVVAQISSFSLGVGPVASGWFCSFTISRC